VDIKKIPGLIFDKHEFLFKGFLFLVSIAIIVYLVPRETKFQFEIKNLQGKAWPFETLIAPFDFPVLKGPEEVKREKLEIQKKARPYFRMDPEIGKRASSAALKEIADSPLSESEKRRMAAVARQILDSVYNTGIINLPDSIAKAAGNDPSFPIAIIFQNLEEEKPVSSFFTAKSAGDLIYSFFKSDYPNRNFIINVLENNLNHNVEFDTETTAKVLRQSMSEISFTKGGIMREQSIISRGEIVTPEKQRILESLAAEYQNQTGGRTNYLQVLGGQMLGVSICMTLLIAFLFLFRKDIFSEPNKIIFILLLMILMILMGTIALKYELTNYYILPFCILPVIIRTFYDTRLALFVHLVTILILSLVMPSPFEFIFLEVTAGIAAIFSIVSMRKRAQIFISGTWIFIAFSLSYTALSLLHDTGFGSISTTRYFNFGVSAALTLFSYPLIYAFEKGFGFVSDVSLMELSDTNSALLRELASKAPGTFQHSIQVADIAEEIVRMIGGNPLLARTGALYHDIGKMEAPPFFVENQVSGINPHDELEFEESARIIISHVIKGVEKARKAGIPDQVIDFIRTHHGTTTTRFFYRSYLQMNPDGTATENDFKYPGPLPYSRETAAVMMADSVEASARSLKNFDAASLENHVEKIINGLVEQEQFVNSDITFRDITKIKKLLKKKLGNIYHHRIEYPK
jgi:cyclic-di-AMP phosphodiesterase PgpH